MRQHGSGLLLPGLPLPVGIRRATAGGGGGSTHPFDGVSGVTGLYSPSRDLLTSFIGNARQTNSGGAYDTWVDQTGNSRTISSATTARPTVATGGLNSIACGDFDGTNDRLVSAAALSAFMSATAGYMIISFIADTITANDASNPYVNEPLVGDAGGFMGLYLRNTTGSPETAQAYNFDGSNDAAVSAVVTPSTAHVCEWWHDSGNLFLCVNNGTPVSVASGNTSNLTNVLGIGQGYTGSARFFDGKIFEVGIVNAKPVSRSTIAADLMAHCGAV